MKAQTNHARIGKEYNSLHYAYDESGQAHQIDDSIENLNLLIDFMNQIIYGTELPYLINEARSGQPVVRLKLSVFVPFIPAMVRLYDDDLAYSPDLALFFNSYRDHPIKEWRGNYNSCAVDFSKLVNSFVVMMRETARTTKIKRSIKDWRRNADENGKRLIEYTEYFFKRYARLCVIRLDLHYRKATCATGKESQAIRDYLRIEKYEKRKAFLHCSEVSLPNIQRSPQVSLAEAKEDWKRFSDNMRGKPSLFEHKVGYIVSFEFSKYGGYHMHVAIFFDGSKVHQDEWLGEEIGEYWIHTTQGRGYYYNCNRHKEKYRNCIGIGIINYHDTEKRESMLSALRYLAKKDQFVRVKNSLKEKTFLSGKIPSDWNQRIGRPRRKLTEVDGFHSEMPPASV